MNEYWFYFGGGILLYIFYRILRKDNKIDKEYHKLINSEKYKVKGQYD